MSQNIIETFLENRSDFHNLTSHAIIADKSKQVVDISYLYPNPIAIKENRIFDDLRGFIDYVNDFKNDTTACFAARDSIHVIFDYHKPDAPQWGYHTASYKIKNSQRWKIWENKHNSWMNQKDFAEFLDTGLNEIIKPTQSEILSLVKNFRATVNYEVDSDADGGNFTFKKTTKSGTTLKEHIEIPEYIEIALEPFENLTIINPKLTEEKKIPAYSLRAKINWRIDLNAHDETTLCFKIQILNFEKAIDETLEAIRSAMHELTGVKTYIG